MAVTTFQVMEHLDVIEDIPFGLFPVEINLAADALALEQLEKALGDGVVVAIASATKPYQWRAEAS